MGIKTLRTFVQELTASCVWLRLELELLHQGTLDVLLCLAWATKSLKMVMTRLVHNDDEALLLQCHEAKSEKAGKSRSFGVVYPPRPSLILSSP
jgi:hypothetical protein